MKKNLVSLETGITDGNIVLTPLEVHINQTIGKQLPCGRRCFSISLNFRSERELRPPKQFLQCECKCPKVDEWFR